MDEVRMIRDGYPEPAPPTAREIARAKALLSDQPRRFPLRLRWGLGGVVVAGAAATVALSLVGGNTPTPTPTHPHAMVLNGGGAFLAAAQKAERQPTGKYWSSDGVQGAAYIMRPGTGTYAITGAHDEQFSWWGAKSGMGEGSYYRELPARPATGRDKELWRRAGSPSSFRVWSNDHYYTYTTKAHKWRYKGENAGTDPRGGGKFMSNMSVEDLQGLPTDPAALARKLLNDRDLERKAGLKSKLSESQKSNAKVGKVMGLLASAPVPPKVRAGLMRALASQPGVRSIGHDTDPLGRRGVALATNERTTTVTGEYGTPKAEQGTYRSRHVLIFDERTGGVLSEQEELTGPGGPYAQMKSGFIINYRLIRSAKWSDTKPTAPAGLPFG